MFSFIFLIIVLSLDSLLVSISYSIKGIHINIKYISLICIICFISLLLSFFINDFLSNFLSTTVIKFIGFISIFSLGIYNIFQNNIKNYISKKKKNKLIEVYLDEIKADFDDSKNLGLYESLILSFVLSLDSLVGGFSINILNINYFWFLLCNFIVNFLFMLIGICLGKRIKNILNYNLSYISGLIIILMAFFKFL